MLPHSVIIFTDGASRGNPGPGGYAAIIIFPESNDNRGELKVESEKFKVQELGGREERTTNNRMELRAAIEALRQIQDSRFKIQVFTDSNYLVNGITKWLPGWQKNGWKTAAKKTVENRDLWEKLLNLTIYRKISWRLVAGHVGVAGNERCDEIATAFADGSLPKLYSGPLSGYPVKKVLDISVDGERAENKTAARAHARAAAYSYVSEVSGKILTHKTWVECQARVKGRQAARYKKVLSPEEEAATITLWRAG